MKVQESNQNGKHNETEGRMLPGGKWIMSEGKNNHKPKVTKFYGKLQEFNDQAFCVVCGHPSQCGDFCSMSCQKEQYGV